MTRTDFDLYMKLVPPDEPALPFFCESEVPRHCLLERDLSEVFFARVIFTHLNMLNASFRQCRFLDTNFVESDFAHATFAHCYFRHVHFERCSFRHVTFSSCTFDGCHFPGLSELTEPEELLFHRSLFIDFSPELFAKAQLGQASITLSESTFEGNPPAKAIGDDTLILSPKLEPKETQPLGPTPPKEEPKSESPPVTRFNSLEL
jgi:Pentapeptide repeats (9 copies)